MDKNIEISYCCDRFKDSVEEGKIVHSEEFDETEWYFPEWLHLYFCPFCGTNIKGRGFEEIPIAKGTTS